MSELAGKRVLVVGLARAGTAASHALLHAGATVVGFDSNEMLDAGRLRAEGVEVHLGREEETLLQGIDLVVKSPGVRGDAPLVAGARARGIPVWDELELGARLLPNPILAVTGTNGKTTTTALLGEILSSGGRSVAVAGNIGRALSSLVGGIEPDTWIVCEVGVFQLDDMEIFHPRIAVLVNLEADHLDRYGDQETYAETKLRLFRLQTENDVAVVPRGFGPVPGAARRSSSRPTIRCPPSRRYRGCTTARTPPRRRSQRARSASPTTTLRVRCGASAASNIASRTWRRSAACDSSTTRRRRMSPPRCAHLPPSQTNDST